MNCTCCRVKKHKSAARYMGHRIEYNGRIFLTWKALASELGIPYNALLKRYERGDCFLAQMRPPRKRQKQIAPDRRPTDPMSGFLPLAQQFCLRPAV